MIIGYPDIVKPQQARLPQRRIAEIEDDEAEAAGLDDEIGDLERALGIAPAADPEETVEPDAGVRGGNGVERTGGIDKDARLRARASAQ